MEPTREVDHAVSALTTEILNLLPIDDAARATRSITLQNAIARLAAAITAQATTHSTGSMSAPLTEIVVPSVAEPV